MIRIAIKAIAILGCTLASWCSYCAADTGGTVPGEGVLTVAIASDDGPIRLILAENTLSKEQISYESYYDQASSGSAYHSQGDTRSREFPQSLVGPQRLLDAPYDVGELNGVLLAAVYPDENPPRILSEEFAIVDLKNNRLVGIVQARAHIYSMKWSPSNRYFSVLLAEYVAGPIWNAPLRWFAKTLGHPISYKKISLAIYGGNGNFLSRKVLATKLRNGTGYIAEWK